MPVWPRLRHGFKDESGSGSVLPLFMLTALLAIGGAATDLASLWRQSETMRATADAAAHAGVVALARGLSGEEALEAAEAAISLNMDPAVFEQAANKPRSDLVRLWHYDPVSGSLSEEGAINAVSVQIRRSELDGNALPTYLLGLLGFGGITTATTAVVVLAPTTSCDAASGLYARGGLTFDGGAEIGAGYCLHSQSSIDMAQSVKFEEGARLSMPDMARCDGFCREEFSPGLKTAAAEVNLISTPPRTLIASIMAEMQGPIEASDRKREFFATRPISSDLEPLAEVGRSKANLKTGSVVRLARTDFEKMRDYPQGLVYVVTCDNSRPGLPERLEVGGMVGAPGLRNSALLTNCPLHFRAGFEVAGALILTAYEGGDVAITAEPDAVLGDTALQCRRGAESVLMALGDQSLPAGLTRSNVAFVVDGNVTLLPDDQKGISRHAGLALHASGEVVMQGLHRFDACAGGSSALLPGLDVVRFVMPKIPAQPQIMMDRPKMPGKKVVPLPSTPSLPMSRTPPADLMSQADLPETEFGL